MLISVKLLTKYVIIIYVLGSAHEKFGVWTGPKEHVTLDTYFFQFSNWNSSWKVRRVGTMNCS